MAILVFTAFLGQMRKINAQISVEFFRHTAVISDDSSVTRNLFQIFDATAFVSVQLSSRNKMLLGNG